MQSVASSHVLHDACHKLIVLLLGDEFLVQQFFGLLQALFR